MVHSSPSSFLFSCLLGAQRGGWEFKFLLLALFSLLSSAYYEFLTLFLVCAFRLSSTVRPRIPEITGWTTSSSGANGPVCTLVVCLGIIHGIKICDLLKNKVKEVVCRWWWIYKTLVLNTKRWYLKSAQKFISLSNLRPATAFIPGGLE
jgi:hypothetical protein